MCSCVVGLTQLCHYCLCTAFISMPFRCRSDLLLLLSNHTLHFSCVEVKSRVWSKIIKRAKGDGFKSNRKSPSSITNQLYRPPVYQCYTNGCSQMLYFKHTVGWKFTMTETHGLSNTLLSKVTYKGILAGNLIRVDLWLHHQHSPIHFQQDNKQIKMFKSN